jgi:hypothetical protein
LPRTDPSKYGEKAFASWRTSKMGATGTIMKYDCV